MGTARNGQRDTLYRKVPHRLAMLVPAEDIQSDDKLAERPEWLTRLYAVLDRLYAAAFVIGLLFIAFWFLTSPDASTSPPAASANPGHSTASRDGASAVEDYNHADQ